MKKINLTLFIFLILSTISYAQDYDLNTYKFRYQKYKGLTTDYGFRANGNNTFANAYSTFENNTSNGLNIDFSLYYFDVQNTEDLQSNLSFSINEGLGASQSKTNLYGKSTNFLNLGNNLSVSLVKTNRYYTGNKFKLRGYNVYLSNNTSGAKGEAIFNSYKNTNMNQTLLGGITIGNGKGRLDNVDDAVSAYFILEDLQQKLGSSYDNEKLEALAKGITAIRNKRYLDTRFGQIEQLTELDKLLNDNGINSNNNSFQYFTTLNDNWRFARRLNRQSGKRFTKTLGIYGYNSLRNIRTSSFINDQSPNSQSLFAISRQANYTLQTTLNANWENHKQLNMKSEKYCGYSGELSASTLAETLKISVDTSSYQKPEGSTNIAKSIFLSPSLEAYYGYIYQPNSRNSLNLEARATLNTSRAAYGSRILPNISETLMSGSLNLTGNYYHWFSPKLALNANGNIYYGNAAVGLDVWNASNSVNSNTITYDLSARLVYQLY